MAGTIWQHEYERILADAREKGDLDDISHSDRRKHPRFRVGDVRVEVSVAKRFSVVDVSVGGICLESDTLVAPGTIINLAIQSAFSIEARVVHCSTSTPREGGQPTHRVHCQFSDENNGMQFLVMLSELKTIEFQLSLSTE